MPLATLTSRVDARDKSTFTALCDSIGITTSAAVNMFVKAAVRENRIPFEVRGDPANQLYNLNRETIETIEAMLEAERIAHDPNVKAYSVEDALRELKKD